MKKDPGLTRAELPPLDQIRQAESEVTRLVAAAREEAERRVAQARRQAIELKNQARLAGKQEGQALFEEIVAEAEQQARDILAKARARADFLQRTGRERIDEGVSQAVALVAGLEGVSQVG